MIYDGPPPALREVAPGQYVVTSIGAGWDDLRAAGKLQWIVRNELMDLVCTVGLDFESLPEWLQSVVRGVMHPEAVIIRLDKA
ncbi:MAG: hypothetical protein EOP83_16280 [Verrucomicrobiaceae bacterium]|nr:MAG: hypothetical protein EOP83_16280 [Verrucomicrobiaceae bacterium]